MEVAKQFAGVNDSIKSVEVVTVHLNNIKQVLNMFRNWLGKSKWWRIRLQTLLRASSQDIQSKGHDVWLGVLFSMILNRWQIVGFKSSQPWST